MIKASSNENDLVLDPFCGCATTILAAKNLNRRWVGIDRRKDARFHIVTRLANMTREQRDEAAELLPARLNVVLEQYEAHYSADPPVRTDEGDTAAPALDQVFPAAEEYALRHAEMLEILVQRFGVRCWGCGFEPPGDDARYLELDHINPKSDGGSNDLDNRALLCGPCNQKKSNKLTLRGLWNANKREGHMRKQRPIDLVAAQRWARQYQIQLIRDAEHQYNLEGR